MRKQTPLERDDVLDRAARVARSILDRSVDTALTRQDLIRLLEIGHLRTQEGAQLARSYQANSETEASPRNLWELTVIAWESEQWDRVIRIAQDMSVEHARGDLWIARTLIRRSWLRAMNDREFESVRRLLDSLLESPVGQLTSVVADAAHLRSYLDFYGGGAIDSATSNIDLAVTLYQHIREPLNECKALLHQSAVRLACAQTEAAQASAIRAAYQASCIPNARLYTLALKQSGISLYRQGYIRESIRQIQVARRLAVSMNEQRWIHRINLAEARALLLAEDSCGARKLLSKSTPSDDPSSRRLHAIHSEYLGIADLLDGNPTAALEHFDHAEQLLIEANVNSYERAEINLRRAEAYNDLGRYFDAVDQCDEGLERLEKVGEGLERGHLLRAKGLALHGLGRPTEAMEHFLRAEQELRRVGDILELGKLLLDKAELGRGDAELRVADAAEAVNLLQRVGIEHEIERARDILEMTQSVLRAQHREEVAATMDFDTKFIAESTTMKTMLVEAKQCAASEAPAVILGETGVGKEVFAHFIHDHSSRSSKPFIAVNCAAIPETLFEREFFGHAKGAFTGADSDRGGLLEAADKGTLFLDEIGEMPLAMQSKLLRVLQDGTYRRVGETKERAVDLRVLAATNRSLSDQIGAGTFREDLYYRLAWFEFSIPALRDRPDDIDAFVKFFLTRESARMDRTYWIEKFAWAAIRRYAWPGNVRELEATIGSACARAGADGCIATEHLPQRVAKDEPLRQHPDSDLNLSAALEKRERELILEALRRSDQKRTQAAKLLCIGRNTLYDKLKKHTIDPELPGEKKANG